MKAGHDVHAFDLSADALARAAENGCTTYTSVQDAVQVADAVVSVLPNGAIVESVYTADVIGHAPAGALLLGSDTPPVAEVIRHGENGRLVGFFDIEGWSREMIRALEDPGRDAGLRRAARETVVGTYDLRRICLPAQIAHVESLLAG